MADFPNMLRRDHSFRPYSKLSPMYSPRNEGAGILGSRGVHGKGVEEPSETGSSPAVDYDDVFGGPPRFATSMFALHSGSLPSAALDRATARVPSFRSSSLPVFDLPVFGDDVFGSGSGSSSAYDPRPASVAYEDIFKEEGQMPDVLPASSLYGNTLTGISRSKQSSRSSSRRTSPVHPAAAFPGQPRQDEIPAAMSSATFLTPRPGAGKFTRRGSSSSFSSFDESGGKPLDSRLTVLRSDLVTSSLPSSPPHAGLWGHLKRAMGSNSSTSVGAPASVEVDDVFGGFPQRSYSQTLSAVQYDTRDASNASGTYTAGGLEKPYLGNKVCSSSPTAHNSDISESAHHTLSSSSSSNDEQGLHDDFIEIRMDRRSDSSVSEKVEVTAGKAWITVNDLSFLTQPSHKAPPARPPSAPLAQLKFKSWKDWASDLPASHSASISSTGLTCDSVLDAPAAATVVSTVSAEKEDLKNGDDVSGYVKAWVEARPGKQSGKNLSAQQYHGKSSSILAVGSKVKVKSAEETVEMEEKELQALLANAWKMNEKREREKNVAKLSQEVPKVSEVKEQEPHWKEQKKHLNMQSKASQPQQSMQEDREVDLRWKEWRKYANRERKEVTRDGGTTDKSASKVPNFNGQVPVQDRVRSLAGMNVPSEAEKSLDTEEIMKVVTEEVSTICPVASTQVSADGWDPKKKPSKEVSGAHENVELLVKEKALGTSDDLDGASSVQNSTNGSLQDCVQYDEQHEISFSEGMEDIEGGFLEMEGESLERRKSRWGRHVRARERAAKALEDMQQRDADVQRQLEAKQQLAETSDQQIKRWAAGKEGNLRALLSNLQHVLWSESGWHPIPLTDLIQGPDVKKAYRKATLFVHPDKVQQKGATVQQKYIAERVFDILQEAWKTFNMQELF